MSFRYELKVRLSVLERIQLCGVLIDLGMVTLHSDRTVTSVYFDNLAMASFHESAEGVTPRKKIRLRSYNTSDEILLEQKTSAIEGRFKKCLPVSPCEASAYLNSGISDQTYGNCFPIVKVEYERSYFQFEGWRLTVDQNIRYEKHNSYVIETEGENVLEFKLGLEWTETPLSILDKFGLAQTRFSKYEKAVLSAGLA